VDKLLQNLNPHKAAFAADACEWYWSIICWNIVLSFFEGRCDDSRSPIIRNFANFYWDVVNNTQDGQDFRGEFFEYHWWSCGWLDMNSAINTQKPRKIPIYRKAKWDSMKEDVSNLHRKIQR
jgi:hypothetical protein